MSWRSELRDAGYDPSKVKDATKPLLAGKVEKIDMRGAVIGSATRCSGARLICRTMDAEMAWVGARKVIVCFNKDRLRRYEHAGRQSIAHLQDKGQLPIGMELKLNPPAPTHKLGARAAYDAGRGLRPGDGTSTRRRNGISIAGEFRR